MKVKLSQLKSNPDNPRLIKDDKFKKLVQSLKDFPEMASVREIVVNKDMVILGGNMRFKAMLEAGWKETEVKVVDWPLEKQKEFIIKDNISGGEWDWDIIANEWDAQQLDDWGVDLPSGFGEEETEEDEAPPVADVAISQLGEIYQLGRHRLMCGDSQTNDISTLMEDKSANMIFTDPPYNVDYGSSKNPRHKIRSIENDKQTDGDWADFNSHLAQTMAARCSGDVYIFGAPGPDGMRARLAYVDAGFHWSATIIWKKQQLVLSPAKYQRMYEPCFYGWFYKSSFNGSRTETEVWEIDRPMDSKDHPTMKPIALCAKGINNSSKKDDIVLDIFGGSGSTLIACQQLGRICYMMELDPKYVDVIRKRWAKYVYPDRWEAEWEVLTPKCGSKI